jgi:hypothetical protein
MKRSAIAVIVGSLATILVMTAACSDDSGDDKCCPVSESFVCENFLTGGARSLRPDGKCPIGITDSIPVSRKAVDSMGCAVWIGTGPLTCGAPFDAGRESGADVSVADASDASALDADASTDAATD